MTVDPYLVPGTQTLVNRAGITDPEKLAVFEARMTHVRLAQLEAGRVTIPGNWDLDHLLAYHRHIFGDVYSWAGSERSVAITKGTTAFASPQFIRAAAAKIFASLAASDHLRGLDRVRFVAEAAHLLSELNVLHPAREGNGRAQRAFLGGLAAQAGWHIDWSQITPEENVAASVAGYHGDERPMIALINRVTTAIKSP